MAGVEGFEPPTYGFGDRRSTNSSYTPRLFLPLFVGRMLTAEAAVLRQLQLLGIGLFVFRGRVVLALALAARQADELLHGLLQNLGDGCGADGSSAFADG